MRPNTTQPSTTQILHVTKSLSFILTYLIYNYKVTMNACITKILSSKPGDVWPNFQRENFIQGYTIYICMIITLFIYLKINGTKAL